MVEVEANGMQKEFVLVNPMGVHNFGGNGVRYMNGRAFFYTSEKFNKIITNEQDFKLSPPLREGRWS